jgi:hypothetical protein
VVDSRQRGQMQRRKEVSLVHRQNWIRSAGAESVSSLACKQHMSVYLLPSVPLSTNHIVGCECPSAN